MFYDIFLQLCEDKGVTPTQAGRDNGVKQQTVSAWKKQGSTPTAATVAKLADYFNVPVEYLLGAEAAQQVDDVLQSMPLGGYAPAELRSQVLNSVLEDEPYKAQHQAESHVDASVWAAYRFMTEAAIKKALLESFATLSRRGKIEAMARVQELEQLPRYTRGK